MGEILSFELISKVLLSLVFVVSIAALAAWAFRKYQDKGALFRKEKRLKIKDVLHIDPKTKTIILEQDDKEHVILINQSQCLHIHTQDAQSDPKSMPKAVKKAA